MRKATPNDIPTLMAIEIATQAEPWSEDIFRQCLKIGYDCWLIEENQKIIAFILVSSTMAGESHILNLCVDVPYQRRGFGCELVTYVLKTEKNKGMGVIFLEVRRTNQPAIALYQKMGFKQINVRKNYYPNGKEREDALVLAMDLGE
ncbi:MAG: ribosomal protein S18-alanine N-acetyltransferase [Gammaproteobacteria bacterium]